APHAEAERTPLNCCFYQTKKRKYFFAGAGHQRKSVDRKAKRQPCSASRGPSLPAAHCVREDRQTRASIASEHAWRFIFLPSSGRTHTLKFGQLDDTAHG